MSMLNHTSRLNCLGSAAFFAAIALMATAAFGGTVNHGDYSTGGPAVFRQVTESGPDIPPGLFVPPAPIASVSGDINQLAFFPDRYILTDQSLNFDLKTLSSQLSMFVTATDSSGFMYGANFHIAGGYDLFAPFTNIPPSGATSIAQVQMNDVPLTIRVTGVNQSPWAGGAPLAATMPVIPSDVTVVGPNGAASGVWEGSHSVDWAALRVAAGLSPTDNITEIQIQATTAVHAASLYASAQASVTNFEAQVAVAVPEPPTVILAGLGVAAVVGQGYRRRKSRRNAEAGSEMVGGNLGAIALTA